MKITIFVVCLALAATTASAAELTLFEHNNFHGHRFRVEGSVDDLRNAGFNDAASSIIVESGTWQVCEDVNFQGRCVTLRPGEYASLAPMGMNDRISSVRELGGRESRQSSRGGYRSEQRYPYDQNPRWGSREEPYYPGDVYRR